MTQKYNNYEQKLITTFRNKANEYLCNINVTTSCWLCYLADQEVHFRKARCQLYVIDLISVTIKEFSIVLSFAYFFNCPFQNLCNCFLKKIARKPTFFLKCSHLIKKKNVRVVLKQ